MTSETTIFQSIPVPAAQSSAPSSKELKPIKWRPYNQTVQLQDLTPQINYGSPIRFAKAKHGQNLGGGEGVSQENPPALGTAAPQHIRNALETVQPKAKSPSAQLIPPPNLRHRKILRRRHKCPYLAYEPPENAVLNRLLCLNRAHPWNRTRSPLMQDMAFPMSRPPVHTHCNALLRRP